MRRNPVTRIHDAAERAAKRVVREGVPDPRVGCLSSDSGSTIGYVEPGNPPTMFGRLGVTPLTEEPEEPGGFVLA